MNTPSTRFDLTPASAHHHIELGMKLGRLMLRILGQAPIDTLPASEPVAA